jgi:pyrroloquinoline quinone biosynthesis protein B
MNVLDPTRTEIYFTHLNHTNPVLQPGSEERRRVEERGFHVADRADSFGLG